MQIGRCAARSTWLISPWGVPKNQIGPPTIIRYLHPSNLSRHQNEVTDRVSRLLQSFFRVNSAAADFRLQHQNTSYSCAVFPVSAVVPLICTSNIVTGVLAEMP